MAMQIAQLQLLKFLLISKAPAAGLNIISCCYLLAPRWPSTNMERQSAKVSRFS